MPSLPLAGMSKRLVTFGDGGAAGVPPPEYTHCELDLSFLLGLSCSLVPFANHDFARRVLYQSEKHSQPRQERF